MKDDTDRLNIREAADVRSADLSLLANDSDEAEAANRDADLGGSPTS
jgi:hypothetical protein